jgi:predicted PP-loop superfamily ATPase
LGNGFTPSGDDFIVGFLFCLNRILSSSNHKHGKFVIMGNTNWASKKFIDYSQNGIVIEPLEVFVNFLLSGENEIKSSLMDLIQVGKSSGIDASIGAIIATVFVFDNDFRNLILTKLNFLK